jgi:hypothetical protein
VPVTIGRALRAAAAAWPVDELFLVTHRALRDVPRVRVVWDALVARSKTTPIAPKPPPWARVRPIARKEA